MTRYADDQETADGLLEIIEALETMTPLTPFFDTDTAQIEFSKDLAEISAHLEAMATVCRKENIASHIDRVANDIGIMAEELYSQPIDMEDFTENIESLRELVDRLESGQ